MKGIKSYADGEKREAQCDTVGQYEVAAVVFVDVDGSEMGYANVICWV
jgi:hypothetical protein